MAYKAASDGEMVRFFESITVSFIEGATTIATFSWPVLAVATQTAGGVLTALISLVSVFMMAVIVPVLGIQKRKSRTKKWVFLALILGIIGFGGFYWTYKETKKKYDIQSKEEQEQQIEKKSGWFKKQDSTPPKPKALDKKKAEKLEKDIKKSEKKGNKVEVVSKFNDAIFQFLLAGFLFGI